MTTLEDVAKQAKVSQKTVSRVINNELSVREKTRERVLLAIKKLDYRPNLFARGLSGGRPYSIRLLYENPNAYYIVALQRGALKACDELGYDLQIHPVEGNTAQTTDRLHQMARQSRLAGLVVAPPMAEQMSRLRELSAYEIPFVRIIAAPEDPDDDIPCVYTDDRSAAYAIVEHLIQIGHTKIAFLWGRRQFSSSVERFRGYQQALADYDVPTSDAWILEGDYSFDDGFRRARRLLRMDDPPTAIVGSNDEIAAGVLAAARALGIRVPNDLSITGFEDSQFSRFSWPPLTTARQNMELMAEHATRLLIAEIQGQHAPDERFCPELVVRGSTAPPLQAQ